MPRRAKIMLVSVVLAAGLLLAWQFRRSPESAAAKSTAEGSTRAEVAGQPTTQPPNAAPPLDLFTTPARQADAANDPAGRFAAAAPGANPSPPAAAPTAEQPGSEKPDATPDHTENAPSKPAEAAVPQLPPSFSGDDHADRAGPLDARNESLPDESTAPTHKIVDGDSLPLLAERYLGSAARAGEIFACNRDVLSDPELLPIGARLRIPTGPARGPLAAAPPAGATSEVAPPATSAAPASPAPQSQIAGETPKTPPLMNIGAPSLSPLPPMGEQTASRARIYIVQTGDTLSVIAQKVYGDSARTDAILQANRDQLRSEQDLRPGMMLETP